MAVAPADIRVYLSGGAANDDPAFSLGGARSDTLASSALNHPSRLLEAEENAAETQHVRCVYIRNTHLTDSLYAGAVRIASQIPGGADLEIGLDPAGIDGE